MLRLSCKVLLVLFFLSCTFKEEKSAISTGDKKEQGTLEEKIELRQVLNSKIAIKLPNGFTLMDAELVARKYPIEGRRPTEVYTDGTGSINIAFNHTQNKAANEDLPQLKKLFESQFNNPPAMIFLGSDFRKINGKDFIVLAFTSQAVDTQIYNLMFITSLENRLLIGTFNCIEAQREEWEPIGKEIIESITIIK